MKFLKILLIIVGILVAAFFIAALIIPKDYAVERTVQIKASHDVVFSQTSDLEALYAWSPWAKKDTAMEYYFEGEAGVVGQKYFWKGNEEVGEGHQEIISISENLIESKLVFLTPMEAIGMSNIKLEDGEDGMISVTWGYYDTTSFPSNVFNLMMDAMMGADFQQGLNELKEICENMPESPKTYRGFSIVELELEPKNYLMHRETVTFDKMQAFFATHFTATHAFLMEKSLEATTRPSAMYFMYDEENMQADLAAGIGINKDITELPEGYELINVESKALKIEYYGNYEGIGEAHLAMDDYIKENNLMYNDLVIEEYVSDPSAEVNPEKWLTNLYYLVK